MKDRSVRIFLAAMTMTLYLLALATGLIVAEYNTRNVAFGDAVSVVAYQRETSQIQVNAFGNQFELDLSAASIHFMGLDSLLNILQSIEKNVE